MAAVMDRPSERPAAASDPGWARWAWAYCAYLVGVILFGAWVRISHSGAGCGAHWPTCNGQVVPDAPSVKTLIEYSHRLTSGLLGLLGLALLLSAARRFGRHRVTWAASVTMAFLVFESLLGAGLVLRELVVDDDSVARAYVVGLHLVNTLLLLGAATLTAWWAGDPRPARLGRPGAGLLWLALAALGVTAMTGAVTALGDTLFPVHPTAGLGLLDRVRDDLGPANHFLVRLRVIHPVIAVSTGGFLMMLPEWIAARTRDATTLRLGRALRHAAALEVTIGALNIWLAAPGWLQILHLAAAQALWMVAVTTLASFQAGQTAPPEAAP